MGSQKPKIAQRAAATADLPTTWSRRDLFRGSGLLLAAIGGSQILSGCDGGDTAGGGGGADDTLTLRLMKDIETLDPAFLTSGDEDAVLICVAQNLVTYRAGSDEPVNDLAEEITSSDDGLTHEFTLREGVRFHGGYGEVTAEDVKYSFERIAGLTKPDIESTYKGDWKTLEEVEVTGKYTGVIKLSEPFAPLFHTTLPGNAGAVISKAAAEELGDDFATNPIGSGPFEFVRWERGRSVLVRRFDNWQDWAPDWAGEPQWREIEFRPISDDNSADIAVETGDLDIGQVAYSSTKRFKSDDAFEVTTQPTLDYAWIGFNVTHPKLSDVRVRRAIRQALDVESMLAAAFDGETRRAHALISPDMPIGHWEDAPRHQPDQQAAKQQLDQAGGGFDMEFGIRDEPGSDAIAEIAQQNLAPIGINVSIKKYPGDQLHEQVKSLQMFYESFSNQADPSWATVWFTSDQVGDWNFMSWSNKEFDRLHDEALVELDEDKRHEMYIEMQELMDEEAVAHWVMYRTNHYAHSSDLEPSLITQRYAKYRAWTFTA
ncbi:MAG: hypothetical protein GEU97_14985 [Actinophytocola sp.]|nr:hypothetical protein [Actinophytocola sp.]